MPYGPGTMQNNDIEALRAGIITLEGQRAQLGDMVVDLALAALRARLASLLRPGGLQLRQVTVLFACESGSRGWGFASPDSDYDVRFLYVHPPEWYLRVEAPRDVIELPIDDELDVCGWEWRKAIGMAVAIAGIVIFKWK